MAVSEKLSDHVGLSEALEKSFCLYETLENTQHPSASDEYQDIVKEGISLLESATHMVNEIGIFSCNESIEEVATSDLKYLLLPALLGHFISKTKFTTRENRSDHLRLTELYYKDFLKRCKSYELPDAIVLEIDDENNAEDAHGKRSVNSQNQNSPASNLQSMVSEREAALNSYRKAKEMEKKLGELKVALKCENEESKREYYLFLLKKWIFHALEELKSVKMEKSILSGMPNGPMEAQNVKTQQREPLKPVIIVKTELQKKVFGLGYPSVPTMTVDEFYKQRYPDAEEQRPKGNAMGSMQQMAEDPDAARRRQEAEDIEEEEKLDREDPVALQKARAFDDWKDENRRGSGNRKNKG